MDLATSPSLIDSMIDILEENQIPKKEERFRLLKELYFLKKDGQGKYVPRVETAQNAYEVDRLHRIGASQEDIKAYLETIK